MSRGAEALQPSKQHPLAKPCWGEPTQWGGEASRGKGAPPPWTPVPLSHARPVALPVLYSPLALRRHRAKPAPYSGCPVLGAVRPVQRAKRARGDVLGFRGGAAAAPRSGDGAGRAPNSLIHAYKWRKPRQHWLSARSTNPHRRPDGTTRSRP